MATLPRIPYEPLTCAERSSKRIVVLASMLLFVAAALPLHGLIGDNVFILGCVPIILAGRVCGVRGVVAMSVLGCLAMGVIWSSTHTDVILAFLWRTTPGIVVAAVLGLGAARFRQTMIRNQEATSALSHEVRARTRAEQELRCERDRMTTYLNTIDVLLIVLDSGGRISLANSAAQKTLGYREEELIGADWFELCIRAHERTETRRVFDMLMSGRGDGVEYFENIIVTRDGQERLVRWHNDVLRDKAGTVVATVGSGLDITESRAAEEDLRLSEELASELAVKLGTITNSAKDAIVMMDADGHVSFWNPAAERIFGWSSTEASGADLHELIAPPDLHAAYEKAFASFCSTGRGAAVGRTVELKARHRDGHEIPVEVSLAGVRVERAWHAIGVVRDISERKETERALEAAKHAAEAAAKAKAEFLANMSHELRTPMNAVIGMSGLLLDTELTAEQRDMVETVRVSSHALLSVINDVLDFSKIDAGRLEIEKTELDVRDVVEQSFDLLGTRAAEKRIQLTYTLDDAVPHTVLGDPGRTRQVLVNLLANAVKFTERGGVRVHVSARSVDHGQTELHFTVQDTGVGIAPDRLDTIFEAFGQADASTTRRFGGTGLGLTISQRLVKLMGGRIWAHSTFGRGSTFSFSITAGACASGAGVDHQLQGRRILVAVQNDAVREAIEVYARQWGMALDLWPERNGTPDVAIVDDDAEVTSTTLRALRNKPVILVTSPGHPGVASDDPLVKHIGFPLKASSLYDLLVDLLFDRSERAARPSSGIDPDLGSRHPLRILVAEDNLINQKVALKILARMGYEADLAQNGREAVDAVTRRAYDVVLMDVQMPEMDGLEATATILNRCAERPRIVAMTAGALDEEKRACLDAGMDDFLSKPIDATALGRSLAACPRRKRAA